MPISEEIKAKLKAANTLEERHKIVSQSLQGAKLPVITKLKPLPPIPKITSDGKRPDVGCTFYYQSKYSDTIIEGTIAKVQYDCIISANGTKYTFKEIWIKDKGEMRDELINKIFDEKD